MRPLALTALLLAALPGRATAQDSTRVACSAGTTGFVSENARERTELATAVAASGAGGPIAEIVDLVERADRPRLRNGRTVAQLLEQNYPEALRDAGVAGEVTLLLKIDEKGAVSHLTVQRSARDPQFNDAAMGVARGMLFRPGQHRGCAIPTWVLIPITFSVGR